MGRHYQIDEWLDFMLEGLAESEVSEHPEWDYEKIFANIDHHAELDNAEEKFEEESMRVYKAWAKVNPDDAESESEGIDTDDPNDVGYNTWSLIAESGGGDIPYDGGWHKAIQKDKKLNDAYQDLENEMYSAVWAARDYVYGEVEAPEPPEAPPSRYEEDLGFIQRHRAKLGMRPLDPAAAGWEPEDIRAEVERLRRLNPRVRALKRRLMNG